MFTSKKAQYLNGKFEKISPITNIDTLYYEQVICDASNSSIFHIERKSVVKNMPIGFSTSDTIEPITKISAYNSSIFVSDTSIIFYTKVEKHELKNPQDNISHAYRYDTSLFEICASTYINLPKILINYEPIDELNDKNASINVEISNRIDNIVDLRRFCRRTNDALNDLSTCIYSNDRERGDKNNDIFLIYYPYPIVNAWNQVPLKVQNVSIINISNNSVENGYIKSVVSLDETNSCGQWDTTGKYAWNYAWINFHFIVTPNNSVLTYLCDSNYNEGNFDFANHQSIYSDYSHSLFNKIYIKYADSSTIFFKDKPINNEIYNSSYIELASNCESNTIINSTGLYIKPGGCNNTIINSSNSYIYYVDHINSSININGNNNTIINCENCDIEIEGDNNFIANLKNKKMHLADNNLIIGDISNNLSSDVHETMPRIVNNRLFLGDSVNMAYLNNLTENCTIFGSSINNVSVYVNSINTTNK